MCLASNEHPDSLGQCSLQLLVQLIDADPIHKVLDILLGIFAPEDDGDVKCHEDVVVGWASSDREFVDDILLGDQELNLGPW